jgi:isoleucyl-tRNA synthetase
MDFNETLNLPETGFPMRANLPQREPLQLEEWEKNRLYYKLTEKNKDKVKYILHDGPPYANGDIHMGTALNKVLKDIIVKYKAMRGFNAVYVPGWDCHGLPIELRALKTLGTENGVDPVKVREHCRGFALSCLGNQKAQFKRLGVWGDFDNPYLTISNEYEAKQVEVFGKMYEKGYIYKGLKPVYWCPDCQTALAEAEIEYEDVDTHSIYVKFRLSDDKGLLAPLGIDKKDAYAVIWTTTTWTLPGNLAICLGPAYEYTFVKVEDETSPHYGQFLLMAKDLADAVMKSAKIQNYSFHGSFTGKELEFVETDHPFLPRKSPIIVGDHVTLESGTGCVHTAPGFGVEDFEVCNSYKGMFDIVVPVDHKGTMTEEAGEDLVGLSTDDANKIIAKKFDLDGSLLAVEKINHAYPHCWRCHNPIIYRATKQVFCSVDKFRNETIKAIQDVEWIPAWGEERIKNMVSDRSDWCISRQRIWGVPIPILYCKSCGETIVNETTISAISDLFRAESSDAWYKKEPSEFIPDSVKCSCGCGEFEKETDIFDVWFDSGCSHEAVLREREELVWPADLYLEGADQFRGWFQSSLLTSVACYEKAPYKAVCTHGWVLDGKGEKMSKSKGNYIVPEEVINQYGADVLRLWVTSLDYHNDLRVSQEMLKQLSETYRKIRNTARFILGNLCNKRGFNPNTDLMDISELSELDKWALYKYKVLVDKVIAAYEEMDYYLAYHALNHFCVVDMSNFYLDIIKDRLYCDGEKSKSRRSSQTAMYIILHGFTRLIAPILSFTADEIWKEIPHYDSDDLTSVVFNMMPVDEITLDVSSAFLEKWDRIHAIRDVVLAALEQKRAAKEIGKSLEAKILLHSKEDLTDILPELAAAFIVSKVELADGEGEYKSESGTFSVTVEKAEGEKCERCWTYSETVGDSNEYPTLCKRCASVIAQ